MAERVGLASMTDLAYIFPGVNISKGLAFCSLEQRYSFFLSALAYISRLSLSLSTSRKLPPTNCYSRHHLNNISSTLSCTALCCFYYNCPGLLLTLRRRWHPTPVLLPGKSHGQRSLVGCSPWGREESDTTERLHFHFSLSCIGGGNGNPLQCSCLENPRDRGAWWAAVYGVAQSQTRLK